uniref:Uncharacterized protein n=1 Tax=Amorphochlora amoebiformis TaxID=1561963 RepID=A0A7S0H3Z0_9EUKA
MDAILDDNEGNNKVERWLKVEKDYANEQLEAIRSSPRPWKPVTRKVNNHTSTILASECVVAFTHLMDDFIGRFRNLDGRRNPDRFRIAKELDRPLVDLIIEFVSESLEDLMRSLRRWPNPDSKEAKVAWEDLTGWIASVSFLVVKLQSWQEHTSYIGLDQYSEEILKEGKKETKETQIETGLGFWNNEEKRCMDLSQKGIQQISQALSSSLLHDLKLWLKSGHSETVPHESPGGFLRALDRAQVRSATIKTGMSEDMWKILGSFLEDSVDLELFRALMSPIKSNRWTVEGGQRLQREVGLLIQAIGGCQPAPNTSEFNKAGKTGVVSVDMKSGISYTKLKRVSSLSSLICRPRSQILKIRAQLGDRSLDHDQTRIAIKSWGLQAMGLRDARSVIDRLLAD